MASQASTRRSSRLRGSPASSSPGSSTAARGMDPYTPGSSGSSIPTPSISPDSDFSTPASNSGESSTPQQSSGEAAASTVFKAGKRSTRSTTTQDSTAEITSSSPFSSSTLTPSATASRNASQAPTLTRSYIFKLKVSSARRPSADSNSGTSSNNRDTDSAAAVTNKRKANSTSPEPDAKRPCPSITDSEGEEDPESFTASSFTPVQKQGRKVRRKAIMFRSKRQHSARQLHREQLRTNIRNRRSRAALATSSNEVVYPIEECIHGRCPPGEKVEPTGAPEIWADHRQALCETLPYYRAYQSAAYTTSGLAKGFMFDGQSHARDILTSNVVIARGGGGLTKDTQTGAMKQAKDQCLGTEAMTIRKNIEQEHPVVLIIGENLPHARIAVPHPYCVLDWFKVTHLWSEKSGGVTINRYRFEKLEPGKDSWWTPKGRRARPLGSEDKPKSISCGDCNQVSERVFTLGWMCLNSECRVFFKRADGTSPRDEDLVYDEAFVHQSNPTVPNNAAPDLRPVMPSLVQNLETDFRLNDGYGVMRGFVCPDCNRCNSKVSMHSLDCGNCGTRFPIKVEPISASSLRSFWNPIYGGYHQESENEYALPFMHKASMFRAFGYMIEVFRFKGFPGEFVAHFLVNKTVLEESNGPDEFWEAIQKGDLGLQRRAMPGAIKGGVLTNNFSKNFGMPYKYVASTESASFDDAPEYISVVRSRLGWAARLAIELSRQIEREDGEEGNEEQVEFEGFNELLALGYLNGQKIDYHDDGEHGLGPTIATLSLGDPATMTLRLKKHHYNGLTNSGRWVTDPAPIGSLYQLTRDEINARIRASPRLQTPRGYRRAAEFYKKMTFDAEKLKMENAPDWLDLRLSHGDVVIMHGVNIQKYFEHAVTPRGKLRFALTCRTIDLESLASPPDYTVGPDNVNYNGNWLAREMEEEQNLEEED